MLTGALGDRWRILTHDGAGSEATLSDRTRAAARVAREAISARVSALDADERQKAGEDPQAIADGAVDRFPGARSFGRILVGRQRGAGASDRSMAWSKLCPGDPA